MTAPNLLEVRQLSIRFNTDDGPVEAVKNISFSLKEGASLAIVGESGSGKSVTALSLTRLLPEPPAEIFHGDIVFRGEHVLEMDVKHLRGSAAEVSPTFFRNLPPRSIPSTRSAARSPKPSSCTARKSRTSTPRSFDG